MAAPEHELIDQVAEEAKVPPETVELVLRLTVDRIQHTNERRLDIRKLWAVDFRPSKGATAERLIEALMPEQLIVPTPAAVLQARRNAQTRTALLEEFGALRSHEVAELAHSRASNRAALANRWRSEHRVVAVPVRDELLYPGFQFSAEGRPKPVVGTALEWLRSDPHTTDWQAALWFATPTSWLGGRRPVDVMDEDPDAVIDAARREASDLVG
jgi:hypothetical protein